jgi:hypothetical protein
VGQKDKNEPAQDNNMERRERSGIQVWVGKEREEERKRDAL